MAGLGDAKTDTIVKVLNSFAKSEIDLDPRDCEHFDGRHKIVIDDAGVVVYYDLKGKDMTMISGCKIQPRAA